MTTDRSLRLRIRRQESADRPETRRWLEVEVNVPAGATVATALRRAERIEPIAWEYGCLEGECGACTLLVNGRVRQACTTRIDEIAPRAKSLVLEPLSKFPVIADLVVDRGVLRGVLERVRGWLDVEPLDSPPSGDRLAPQEQRLLLATSRCSDCGACLEACPEWGEHGDFVGAAALNQVRRLALVPAGKLQRAERLEAVMAPGGVSDCGKAQNCVEVCPLAVPLVDSIQTLSREASKRLLFDWLLGSGER
jgi:succinate dehydrogenase / fumarate reductase, iron-sulfur subunit